MTTANNIKGQNLDINEELITALYCRLSVEDIKDDKDKKRKNKEDESNSISNQKQILLDSVSGTVTRTQCFSWMTEFPARALTVATLTVCRRWLRKVRFAELL